MYPMILSLQCPSYLRKPAFNSGPAAGPPSKGLLINVASPAESSSAASAIIR